MTFITRLYIVVMAPVSVAHSLSLEDQGRKRRASTIVSHGCTILFA